MVKIIVINSYLFALLHAFSGPWNFHSAIVLLWKILTLNWCSQNNWQKFSIKVGLPTQTYIHHQKMKKKKKKFIFLMSKWKMRVEWKLTWNFSFFSSSHRRCLFTINNLFVVLVVNASLPRYSFFLLNFVDY